MILPNFITSSSSSLLVLITVHFFQIIMCALFLNVFSNHFVGQNQRYIIYTLWQMNFLVYFFEQLNYLQQQQWVCLYYLDFWNPPQNLQICHHFDLQHNYYHRHFLFHRNGEYLQVYIWARKKLCKNILQLAFPMLTRHCIVLNQNNHKRESLMAVKKY